MNKITKKEKIELIGILCLLVIVIYYEFIINPIMNQISTLKNSISTLEIKSDNMKDMEIANKRNEAKKDKLEETYIESSTAIPEGKRSAEIVHTINNYCSKEKVTVDGISFNDDMIYTENNSNNAVSGNNSNNNNSNNNNNKNNNSNNNIGNYSGLMQSEGTIKISGNYQDVLNSIADFENDNRIFKVTGFEISSGNKTSDGTGNLNISSDNNGGTQAKSYEVSASITGNYYFYNSKEKQQYDFNSAPSGKSDLFK